MSPEAAPSQAEFAAAVLDPALGVPEGIARANGGDPREAFNVYRNNVVASLADALKAAFPITAQLLGEGLQRALMADFVRAHPPASPVLSAYGDGFPAYLAEHPATRARPFLADVALLERRRIEAYHAADAPVLDGTSLSGLDAECIAAGIFFLHPATRLVASRFPVAGIHAMEKAALDGTLAEGARASLDMSRGEAVLITRPGYEVMMLAIGPGEAAFLTACGNASPFAEAAETGFSADAAFDLQACLTRCLAAGAFCAFQTDTSLE